MIGGFAGRFYAIVAIRAASCHWRRRRGVIKRRARPRRGRTMAAIALRRGRDMRRGLGLRVDRHIGTAVAGRTVAGRNRPCCPAVTHVSRRKSGVALVAHIAFGRRRDMRRGLRQRILRYIAAVMTSRAITGGSRACGAGMIHRRRREGGVILVTRVALGAGRDMGAGFAQGIGAVMAARTAAGGGRIKRGMVDRRGRPTGR